MNKILKIFLVLAWLSSLVILIFILMNYSTEEVLKSYRIFVIIIFISLTGLLKGNAI